MKSGKDGTESKVVASASARPAKRKRGKRKARAKARLRAVPAAADATAPANSDSAAQRESEDGDRRETAVVTPAFLAREEKARESAQNPGLAAVASAEAAPAEPQQVEVPAEPAAAEVRDNDGAGRQWPWMLLVSFLALGALAYWKWPDRAPEYLRHAGDWTEARIEELALKAGLLPLPPEEIAPAAGGEEVAPAAAPQSAARPTQEEIELPTPPPLLLAQVVELETLLLHLGFDAGEVNGVVDERTREAISQFQEWDGQAVDGEPSRALLDALREVAGYQGNGG